MNNQKPAIKIKGTNLPINPQKLIKQMREKAKEIVSKIKRRPA